MLSSLLRLIPAGCAIFAAAVCTVGVAADDAGATLFSFSSFGTLGVVHSGEKRADFTSTLFKPDGAGHSHNWSADVDSLIAAQLTANFSPEVSAVVQVISEQDSNNSYAPHLEWANLKYQFTPDLSMRIGRTAVSVFMLTESRKIGYTLPWVRAPLEVYSRSPFTSNDGFDASYRFHIGHATNTVQFAVGQSDAEFTGGGGSARIKVRGGLGVANTLEQGYLTLHFNLGRGRFTIPEVGPLFDAFRQFGAEGLAIAEKYDVDNREFKAVGIGATYDPGHWFVTSEWARVDTDSVLGENTGWYVSGGHRVGRFTPYVTYAEANADNRTSDPGLTVSALPPFLAGFATSLNAALNATLSTKVIQNTITIGTRWDVMTNVALKVQFDHTRMHKGSPGTLTNLQPGFQPGGNVNVVSATIDFVL